MVRPERWFGAAAALAGILLAAVNNAFVGYEILTIGVDRVIQAVLFLLLLPAFARDCAADPLLRRFVWMSTAFVLLRLLSALVGLDGGEEIEAAQVLRGCIETISFPVLLYLCYFAAHRYPRSLGLYLGIHALIWVFAALQHPFSPIVDQALAWKMKYFGVNLEERYVAGLDAILSDPHGVYSRVSGPYESCIVLSYALVSALGVTAYAFVKSGKRWLLGLFVIGAVTSALTLTRSLLGAVGVLGLFLAIHMLRSQRGVVRLLPLGAVAVAAFAAMSLLGGNSLLARLATYEDASAQGKIPLMVAGGLALLSNPLHVSPADYLDAQYASFDIFREKEVLLYGPHNGLLNLGFTYTTFGLLIFVWFMLACWRSSRLLDRPVRACFGAVLLAYLVHTSFHNNFLFLSERHALVPLAVFFAEVRRAREKAEGPDESVPMDSHVDTRPLIAGSRDS